MKQIFAFISVLVLSLAARADRTQDLQILLAKLQGISARVSPGKTPYNNPPQGYPTLVDERPIWKNIMSALEQIGQSVTSLDATTPLSATTTTLLSADEIRTIQSVESYMIRRKTKPYRLISGLLTQIAWGYQFSLTPQIQLLPDDDPGAWRKYFEQQRKGFDGCVRQMALLL